MSLMPHACTYGDFYLFKSSNIISCEFFKAKRRLSYEGKGVTLTILYY